MNIISYNEVSNNCFANIIETLIDLEKTPYDDGYIIKKPGISISVFGQTEETKVGNVKIFLISSAKKRVWKRGHQGSLTPPFPSQRDQDFY